MIPPLASHRAIPEPCPHSVQSGFLRLELRNQEPDRIRIGHAGGTGIHQVAFDRNRLELLLKLEAEVEVWVGSFWFFPISGTTE
jgi:hypothetical protein